MPDFTTIPVEEARRVTGVSKRQQELAAYIDSVTGLPHGTAGKVTPSEGETLSMVRRRVGDAGRASGRDLEIRRTDDAVYYWASGPRRRGRPRKVRG